MRVDLDFETRSQVDLPKCGVSVYARDESTRALMLAYCVPDIGISGQWNFNLELDADTEGCPKALAKLAHNPRALFVAHNASFERYIWTHVMVARYGWPAVPLERWRCTAAQAAHANLPRSLAHLGRRLGLSEAESKGQAGKRLITLLSKPRKMSKKRAKAAPATVTFEHNARESYWEDNAELLEEFRDYNRQDVTAETAIEERLPTWPAVEQRVWLLDQRINERGVPVDLPLCYGALKIAREGAERANERLAELTAGEVTRTTQVAKLGRWINERVNFGSSLSEALIEEWLQFAKQQPPEVVEALQLRLSASSAAVKKYKAAALQADEDGRVRESLKYYGAATGRWAGRGIQPHNFKKARIPAEPYYQAITTGDYDTCALLAENPITLLKKAVRGLICAPPGKKLIVSDFAGIEARVLAWLAGEHGMVRLFAEGQDVYIAKACEIYGVEPAEIADWNGTKWKIQKEHSSKRDMGKAAVLGLGYQMGAEKFAATVKAQQGIELEPEFAEQVVNAWRQGSPRVVKLWYDLERACLRVIQDKSKAVRLGKLTAHWHPRGFLCIRLPSGRDLFYYQAQLGPENRWGKRQLIYQDGGKGSAENPWTSTYGGKLVENVVQAISRDLLVNSLFLLDGRGMEVVLHVHDEAVVEAEERDPGVREEVHRCMQTLPTWAAGLPLEAETDEHKRYTK